MIRIGSSAMPKSKEVEQFATLGEKDCWHPYGLQVLSPTKFTAVVGKILKGRYILVSSRFARGAQQTH